MSAQPTASVIICVYTEKRWDDILDAVASCENQSEPPDSIIIVVDHNSVLLNRLKGRFPQHVVVPNHSQQGLSGGRNTGVDIATTDLVAFLDDDAVADRSWLEILKAHCGMPGVLGAGSRVEPRWDQTCPKWFPAEFLWVVGCTYRGVPTTVTAMRNLMGGCMCVHRSIFATIGGFHSGLGRSASGIPLNCEETELCIRATRLFPESKFIYDPAAVIHHRVPALRMTGAYLRSRCFSEGFSKALLATLAGSGAGLSSERAYTFKVLPAGVLRGLADTLFRLDPWGTARALAIGFGFFWTLVGFVKGRLHFDSRFARQASRQTA